MKRPTIRDLSAAAGVSVSTVNRALAGSGKVRETTLRRVLAAAESIGFYGIGSLHSRVAAARPKYRFVALLLQRGRPFYEKLAFHLQNAARSIEDREVELEVHFMDDLSPDHVADGMLKLGSGTDGVAIVTAEHPLVTEAIETLSDQGTPVMGLISPLSARSNVGYVGLDNWKVGRTAAWAFDHICFEPGKIAILVGNHRYRNQELNESGFRSYFREFAPEFTLLEPRSTFESSAIAREMTEQLLHEHPDLAGLYVSGGGITGSLSAIRDSGKRDLVTVGYDLIDVTKAGLLDGSLTFVISHPYEKLAREAIRGMIRARQAGADAGSQRVLLDFDIYTRENI